MSRRFLCRDVLPHTPPHNFFSPRRIKISPMAAVAGGWQECCHPFFVVPQEVNCRWQECKGGFFPWGNWERYSVIFTFSVFFFCTRLSWFKITMYCEYASMICTIWKIKEDIHTLLWILLCFSIITDRRYFLIREKFPALQWIDYQCGVPEVKVFITHFS